MLIRMCRFLWYGSFFLDGSHGLKGLELEGNFFIAPFPVGIPVSELLWCDCTERHVRCLKRCSKIL